MPVGEIYQLPIAPVAGVRLSTMEAGVRYSDRKDLVLFELAEGTNTAAVFTQNAFAAAPVLVCREHLQKASPRYWLINTGNANAGTGQRGLEDAHTTCQALATHMDVPVETVLPFSTGVTTEFLPTAPIVDNITALAQGLTDTGWNAAAEGIMTTDTVAKGLSVQFEIDGEPVTISGITKGSGMIKPDMATMLSFLATDAAIAPPVLQEMLVEAMGHSFNRITIDGDTSTNDACVLAATGQGVRLESEPAQTIFTDKLKQLCQTLAQYMVRDGEGATKFVTINVTGGASSADCLTVAYRIAHSPLVKTAFSSGDANLGRIMVAIGNAEVAGLKAEKVQLWVGGVRVLHDGVDVDYTEDAVKDYLQQAEIEVRVDLDMGAASETVWTCDLSHEYVSINADYRS